MVGSFEDLKGNRFLVRGNPSHATLSGVFKDLMGGASRQWWGSFKGMRNTTAMARCRRGSATKCGDRLFSRERDMRE
ncbi:hypothetical protein HanIR_Chr09g0448741 [Helianthus annuus]|nr:hypothetical protein HanIR_Chr09g0448741 [Helianthus annuus]